MDGVAPADGEYPSVPAREEAATSSSGEEVKDAFWLRMANTPTFDSVEQARDTLDRCDWREVERARQLAAAAAKHPARTVDPKLGSTCGRSYRQVNVKLGEPDFEALKALAVDRDLPPSTMARILIRKALREGAPGPSG